MNEPRKNLRAVAHELAACSDAWEDCARLVGNVRADELGLLAEDYLLQRDRIAALEAEVAQLRPYAAARCKCIHTQLCGLLPGKENG